MLLFFWRNRSPYVPPAVVMAARGGTPHVGSLRTSRAQAAGRPGAASAARSIAIGPSRTAHTQTRKR